MSQFEVGRDLSQRAPTLCPHCNEELHLTLRAWDQQGIESVIKSNCPYCSGEIFAVCLIITDVRLPTLVSTVEAITTFFEEHRKKLLTERTGGIITP